MKPINLTGATILLILFCNSFYCVNAQQILISKVWETDTGTQYFFRKSKTYTDAGSNVYIVGETVNGAGNYDWLIAKYDNTGFLLWMDQFDGAAGGNDLAIDLYVDGSSNVFVTGGVTQSSGDSLDLCIRKYNSSGVVQWTKYYAGSANGNDVGTSIVVKTGGDVFVGGTAKTGNKQDFILLCLKNNNGGTIWSQLYNYNGNDDAGVRVYLSNPLSGTVSVYIAGGSQSDSVTWDLAIANYYQAGGALIGVNRISGGTGTFYEVSDMTLDNQNNIYITGSFRDTTGEVDIRTVKLDDSLTVIWDELHSSPDTLSYDKGNAVKVDSSGNVYVTGFVTKAGEGKNAALLKYNSSGALQYERTFNGQANGDDSGQMVALDANNNPVITGYTTQSGSGKDYLTAGYSSAGNLLWQTIYQGSSGMDDIATDLVFDPSGNLVVTGQSQTGLVDWKYQTILYERMDVELEAVHDTAGNPVILDHEIIVRFDTSFVHTDAVDEIEKRFGWLTDFVDSSLVTAMSAKTGIDFFKQKAIKIYSRMTTNDTTSTSRLGRSLKIPVFWASFRITLPEEADILAVLDSLNDRDSLSGLFPDIRYAEPNWVVRLNATVPNDTKYQYEQAALHHIFSYTDAHIKAEDAWDNGVDARGKEEIRLGIFDTGINYNHEDFSLTGSANSGNSLINTKILQGTCYWYPGGPVPTTALSDADGVGHGTNVAGIAGAIRNNGVGVAGVAGGDFDDDGNTGVSLYDMNIFDPYGDYLAISSVVDAMWEGADGSMFATGKLDIMNHSWALIPGEPLYNAYSINELKHVVRFAFENEVTQVCARGNDGADILTYPASYYPQWEPGDDWVISVGASGDNGERLVAENGGASCPSNFGPQLDVVAPGFSDMIPTTGRASQTDYVDFGCTSAATPFVSGMAALLMGYHPTPLAPEDVEHLIEYGAEDKLPGTGYDQATGWGLLDAGASIDLIEHPHCRVVHFEVQSSNYVLDQSNLVIDDLVADYDIFPQGPYLANVYKCTETVNHTGLGLSAQIMSVSGKPGYWVRNSGSTLWGPPVTSGTTSLLPETNIHFETTPDIYSATVTGYYYEMLNGPSPFTVLPYNADQGYILAYSLLVCDPDYYTQVGTEKDAFSWSVFPNPSSEQVSVKYHIFESCNVNLTLTDMQGKEVRSIALGHKPAGEYVFQMDLGALSGGIYMLTLRAGANGSTQKLVKM